jgi:hypothetical protein
MTNHIVDANKMVPSPHLLKKFSEQARVDSKKRGHSGYCKTFAKLCIDWALNSQPSAALAQQHVSQPYKLPEPVAPTDEEIMELMPQQMRDDLANAAHALAGFDRANVKAAGAMRIILNRHAVNHARAVLARWGTPAIEPVPVSERMPEPEDCDAEGGCWWWHPDHKEDDFIDGWILLDPKWAGSRRDSDDSLIYTHWLPHWALPVPAPTNTINQEDYDCG